MVITIVLLPVAVFVLSLICYVLTFIVAEPLRARWRDLAFYLVLCAIFLALLKPG